MKKFIPLFLFLISFFDLSLGSNENEKIFSDIFNTGHWFSGESVSGDGSHLRETQIIRNVLPKILEELNIEVMIDAACGDLNWMKKIKLPIKKYIGIDIVEKLIENNNFMYGNDQREFIHLDIVKDQLPLGNLILCRDCLTHYPFQEIKEILINFKKSGAKYLLASTYPDTSFNKDLKITGYDSRPLNMQKAPFNFPAPLKLIDERSKHKKYLGLWMLQDIQISLQSQSKELDRY